MLLALASKRRGGGAQLESCFSVGLSFPLRLPWGGLKDVACMPDGVTPQVTVLSHRGPMARVDAAAGKSLFELVLKSLPRGALVAVA